MTRPAFLISLFVSCFVTLCVQAQDVDKIIERHYEKAGGIKNWKKLKSLRSNAKIIQQGMEMHAMLRQKHPNKQRVEMDFQGQNFVESYNGKDGWAINPFIQAEPRMLTGEELKELEDRIMFDNPLIDHREKGNTVIFEGTETIEGTEYDKVKLTKKNGNVHYYLFGKDDSFKVILRRTILAGPMKGQSGETYLSDYRPVGNIMMPFLFVNKVEGEIVNQVQIDKCEVNIEIDDAAFEFPTK